MKAVVLSGSGAQLEVAEVPDPTPGPGQVLVRASSVNALEGGIARDLELRDPETAHRHVLPVVGRNAAGGSMSACSQL
jgi:NADPH:quinone reductase-like Zn-dependent oxidoreductase